MFSVKNMRRFTPIAYLILSLGIIIVLKPLITPRESSAARLFVETNPLFLLLFSYLAFQIFVSKSYVKRFVRFLPAIVSCLALFVICNHSIGVFQSNITDADWVKQSVDFLDAKGLNKATPVFVTYQQLPFMLYSEYNVDLIWPIRKSYLDSYPGTFYLIINRPTVNSRMFYRGGNIPDQTHFNFYDRIQQCLKVENFGETEIYECPSKAVV
jgi:hypothetical protein